MKKRFDGGFCLPLLASQFFILYSIFEWGLFLANVLIPCVQFCPYGVLVSAQILLHCLKSSYVLDRNMSLPDLMALFLKKECLLTSSLVPFLVRTFEQKCQTLTVRSFLNG